MGIRRMGAVMFTKAWRRGEAAEGDAPEESLSSTLRCHVRSERGLSSLEYTLVNKLVSQLDTAVLASLNELVFPHPDTAYANCFHV